MATARKITRTLIHFKNLIVKIHVRIVSEKDGQEVNFHHSFVTQSKDEYIDLDIQTFITLEYKDGGEWTQSKSITLTDRNMIQLIKGLKLCIHNIEHGGIFAVKEKTREIVSYRDKVHENTVSIPNLGSGRKSQQVVLQPGVIYDAEDDITYEGVVMYLNNQSNAVELTIDQLDALYYVMSKINIFEYSQLLINYYVAAANKVDMPKSAPVRRKQPHPLDMTPKETMSSTIKKSASDLDTFEGLK